MFHKQWLGPDPTMASEHLPVIDQIYCQAQAGSGQKVRVSKTKKKDQS